MNGILFYLDRDVPLVHGHAIYIDSEWALTSISQAQFWREDLTRALRRRPREGDPVGRRVRLADAGPAHGQGRGALQPRGDPRRGLGPAHRPPQRRPGAGARRAPRARAGSSTRRSSSPTRATPPTLEPLLINTAGSWADRPDAATRIPNLLLAADYVRTYTDLATMEGANEAARRAVNAILDATGSRATRCDVFTLREPPVLAPGAHARRAALAAVPPARAVAAEGERRRGSGAALRCCRARRWPPGTVSRRRG